MSKYGKKMEAVVTILVDSYNAGFLKSLTHSAMIDEMTKLTNMQTNKFVPGAC